MPPLAIKKEFYLAAPAAKRQTQGFLHNPRSKFSFAAVGSGRLL
jgi:hypothetical protein